MPGGRAESKARLGLNGKTHTSQQVLGELQVRYQEKHCLYLLKLAHTNLLPNHTNFEEYMISYFVKTFSGTRREAVGKRGRGGNSFPLQPFSFPPRPSGLGFCETPAAFRSKWVRADFSIAHQTGNCKFLEAEREVC